ncbi:hypothetical protein [Priestia megaterium]|uniref:hypothetical protein n=1 Tax=Priestia megaterium TaxID=1404 RepID=UPI0024466B07|nr:hypothetical protein [Priestia megaterium]MEE3897282.1 hypothetical protein [Priestia megaterium]WRQ95660.1 hypothetical protein NQ126_028055 [Priestia megaterium]
MKKNCSVLIATFLFIALTGCESKVNDPLDFSGENKNWSANITLYPAKNNKEIALINLNYLGDQIKSIGDFGISLKNSNNKNGIGIRDIRLDKEGKFKEKIEVDTDKKINTSDPLVLTVEWNDKSEGVLLKAQ